MCNLCYNESKGGDKVQTDAERKAVAKYHAKFDDIKIRVPKGNREKYKDYAEVRGMSLNQLIIKLLDDHMRQSGYIQSDDDINIE